MMIIGEKKYRQRFSAVTAIQVTSAYIQRHLEKAEELGEEPIFTYTVGGREYTISFRSYEVIVQLFNGKYITASVGDYIITNPRTNEKDVMTEDRFIGTYEEVEELSCESV